MRKIISIKKINSIFLITVLIAGTIVLSSPSFMIGAQAESEYYGMNNNYYKSEDRSVTIDCNNFNINPNGLKRDAFTGSNVADGLNPLAQEESMSSSSSDNDDNEGIRANSIINSDERNSQYKLDEDVVVKCLYNNDNEISPTPPPPPPCVTVDTITGLGDSPFGIAYDPVHERMFVANIGTTTVSIIDTNTNTVIGSPISVGDAPSDIAYDEVNERMYVTNFFDDTVSVIDTTTNTVIDTITVGDGANGIEYDPVHDRMYVTNAAAATVSVIDTNTNTVVSYSNFCRK